MPDKPRVRNVLVVDDPRLERWIAREFRNFEVSGKVTAMDLPKALQEINSFDVIICSDGVTQATLQKHTEKTIYLLKPTDYLAIWNMASGCKKIWG